MPLRLRHLLPAVLLLLVVAALPAAAPAAVTVQTPRAGALYHDGAAGRYLLGGAWLFRRDDADQGIAQGWAKGGSTVGWTATTVPNAWNVGDASEASMKGTVGWYRKDFRLPDQAAALRWVLRFETVNYRAQVWMNGRRVGDHTGGYLPFELDVPRSALRRSGVNTLIVRVDNRRRRSDFPPLAFSSLGEPTGGWWNYGGITREVYLRRVDTVDLADLRVTPRLACTSCAAGVEFAATVRNLSPRAVRTTVTGRFGTRRVALGTRRLAAGATAVMTGRVRVPRPRLWSPTRPYLYDASAQAAAGAARATYVVRTGVRSITVSGGRLYLNGRLLNVRGVGLHEADQRYGSAITNAVRDRQLAEVRELGATMVRSHYPMHPYFQERADALGILQWSEIPVYSVPTTELKKLPVRLRAVAELRRDIAANANHPSVLVWSIGNELSTRPGPIQADYIKRAADAAHADDPTRPVGYAVAGYPNAGCQKEYDPLDVLGVNEYFGWYPGPNGQVADKELLSSYLDGVRACYRDKAIIVTEFGAEANHAGPAEEKGSYAFQKDFVSYHLSVLNSKAWLSGAIYWALEEFWVRPGWSGGNPDPTPPLHTKGLITFGGVRKPAFAEVQRLYRATRQYPAPAR